MVRVRTKFEGSSAEFLLVTFVLGDVKLNQNLPETMEWMCEMRSRLGPEFFWTHDIGHHRPECCERPESKGGVGGGVGLIPIDMNHVISMCRLRDYLKFWMMVVL